jgi:hypothetical protein
MMGVRFPTRVRTTQVPYDRPIPRFQSCPKNTMGNFPRGFLCELLVVELKNSLGLGSNSLRCTVPRNSKTAFPLVSSYLHLVKQSPPVHQTIFGKLVSSRMIQSPLYSQSGKQPYFGSQKPLNVFADFGHFLDYLPQRTEVHKRGSEP